MRILATMVLAAAAATAATTATTTARSLFAETSAHGATIHGALDVGPSPGAGRGLFVTADVPEGTELLAVPAAAQLSADSHFGPVGAPDIAAVAGRIAEGDESGASSTVVSNEGVSSAALMLALARTRLLDGGSGGGEGAPASFAAYVAALPPLNATASPSQAAASRVLADSAAVGEDELLRSAVAHVLANDEAVAGAIRVRGIEAVRKHRVRKNRGRAAEHKQSLDEEDITVGADQIRAYARRVVDWAVAVVRSHAVRGFSSSSSSSPRSAGRLVPLVDMVNHSDSSAAANARVVQRSDGTLMLVAKRAIVAGEEVRVNYLVDFRIDYLSCGEWLHGYGFVPMAVADPVAAVDEGVGAAGGVVRGRPDGGCSDCAAAAAELDVTAAPAAFAPAVRRRLNGLTMDLPRGIGRKIVRDAFEGLRCADSAFSLDSDRLTRFRAASLGELQAASTFSWTQDDDMDELDDEDGALQSGLALVRVALADDLQPFDVGLLACLRLVVLALQERRFESQLDESGSALDDDDLLAATTARLLLTRARQDSSQLGELVQASALPASLERFVMEAVAQAARSWKRAADPGLPRDTKLCYFEQQQLLNAAITASLQMSLHIQQMTMQQVEERAGGRTAPAAATVMMTKSDDFDVDYFNL